MAGAVVLVLCKTQAVQFDFFTTGAVQEFVVPSDEFDTLDISWLIGGR